MQRCRRCAPRGLPGPPRSAGGQCAGEGGPGEGAVRPRFHRRAAPIPRRCWGPWPLGSPHPAPLSLFSTLIASEQGGGAEVTLGDVVGGGSRTPRGLAGPRARGRASPRAWAVAWSWPRDPSGGPGFVLPPARPAPFSGLSVPGPRMRRWLAIRLALPLLDA